MKLCLFVVLSFNSLLFGADFSQSLMVKNNSGTEKLFERLKKERTENKHFIETMITDQRTDPSYWNALIILAYDQDVLSPNDLYFIIEQQANPKILSQEEAKNLFLEGVINRLKEEKRMAKVVALLNTVAIPKGNLFDSTYKSLGWTNSVGEMHNVLVASIEHNYMNEFRLIMKEWPKNDEGLAQLSTTTAVTRDKYKESTGFFGMREHKYEPESFALMDWLMRTSNGASYAYLQKGTNQKPAYLEAAQEILKFISDCCHKKEKKLCGSMLNMVALLERDGALPQVNYNKKQLWLTLEDFIKATITIEGFDRKSLNAEQENTAGNSMPEELKEAWSALK